MGFSAALVVKNLSVETYPGSGRLRKEDTVLSAGLPGIPQGFMGPHVDTTEANLTQHACICTH